MSNSQIENSKIRAYDADGRLEAAGFVWTEARLWVEKYINTVLPVPIILLVIAIGGSSQHRWTVLYWTLAGLVLLLLPVIVFGRQKRAVVFHRDGRITTPYGIPYCERRRALFDQSQLASIEVYDGLLVLFSREGVAQRISNRREELLAHLLAAQLNNAFNDIRETRASLAQGKTAAHRARARVIA